MLISKFYNKRSMKYYVYACAKDISDLFEKINKLIDLGFEPLGSVYYDSEGIYNYQTLINDIPEGKTAEQCYYDYHAENVFAVENEEDTTDAGESSEDDNDLTKITVTPSEFFDEFVKDERTEKEINDDHKYNLLKSFNLNGADKNRIKSFCRDCETFLKEFGGDKSKQQIIKHKYEEAKIKLKGI